MVSRELVCVIQDESGAQARSYERFLAEGDRLFRLHLDPCEGGNHLDAALNAYARALEDAPQSAELAVRMAKIFLKQGLYPKAERYAKKALKAFSQSPPAGHLSCEAWTVLGVIHYQYGQYDRAAEAYTHAIRTGGIHAARARMGLFQTSLAQAKEEDNDFKAFGHLVKGLYAAATSFLLYPFERERLSFGHMALLLPQLALAWLADEFGATDTALERYLDIYQRFPGLASVGVVVSDFYREKAQYEKALYWLHRVISRHPNALQAHYQMARLYAQREEYALMIDAYEHLTRLSPGDPHVFCNLANAYYYNQQYKEALQSYETALHLGTDTHWKAMVAQSMANIYADYLQNEDAAIAYYEMAKALEPREIENYIQLGLLYFQKDDYPNAELIYRKAIRIAPDHARLYSNMGYLRWMEGDLESAIHYYEKAIKLDSGYEIPLNNLGVIYLDSLGQVSKAIGLFEQAITINENYALAYYNLGRAHSFIDNRAEAANCFQIAQQLNQLSRELDNEELTARINNLFE